MQKSIHIDKDTSNFINKLNSDKLLQQKPLHLHITKQ